MVKIKASFTSGIYYIYNVNAFSLFYYNNILKTKKKGIVNG